MPPNADRNAIFLRDIRKEFTGRVALSGLDLDVRRGELFGLVGPDGAGKTTCLRLLSTVMLPTCGEGSVAGHDLRGEAETIKQKIGYVPQRFSLYGELTVRENMAFYADIYKVFGPARDERFARLLAFSRLEEFRDRLARDLSGGMRQKLALSCALIHTPEVLLLDEPTTGVDPISRRELWKLLLQLWRQGSTIVVTTPYMDEAERCERVGFLRKGELLRVGTPRQLRQDYPWEVVELTCDDRQGARARIREEPGIRGVEIFGDKLHVKVESAERWLADIPGLLAGARIAVRSARRIDPSLEDVFLSLARDDDGP